jgi:hypothetical protein
MNVGFELFPPAFLLVRVPCTYATMKEGMDGKIKMVNTFDEKGGAGTFSSHAMFVVAGAYTDNVNPTSVACPSYDANTERLPEDWSASLVRAYENVNLVQNNPESDAYEHMCAVRIGTLL